MNEVRISAFLLERYHIGEVTPEEKRMVEEAAAADVSLAAALADLNRADQDFYRQFPKEKIFPAKHAQRTYANRLRLSRPTALGLCAAAMLFVIAFPLFVYRAAFQSENLTQTEFTDRAKGASSVEQSFVELSSIELSVYVKGNSAGEEIKLADQSFIREGNIVQLVYHVFGEKYGVIFSIDGRSYVTLHYPYNIRQDTRLVSGRTVPLDEAYKLDDAPHYEIFFFVTGDTPMDVRDILNTARQLAFKIEENSKSALQLGTAAFNNYELEVFTLIKE